MVSMAEGKKAPIPRIARWRWKIQSLASLVWLSPALFRIHTVCSPVFHCYSCPWALFACPIGVVANYSAVHAFPFLAAGTLLIAGVLLGSFWCGWACPFGFFQDLLDRIPTPKWVLPGWTGNLRYVVLVGLVIVLPYWVGAESEWFFCRLCPAGALEGAVPNVVQSNFDPATFPAPLKLGILGVFLASALFIWRPWCSLLCPLGAVYSLFNKASFFILRYHEHKCIDCRNCWGVCHTGEDAQARIDQMRCIRCLECTRCRSVTVESVFHPKQDSSTN